MGNLGWYQRMTFWAKRVGGPKAFMGFLIGCGTLLGAGAYAGGQAINSRIREYKERKRKKEADAAVYTVEKDGTSNEGLIFRKGDQFKVLAMDGDAGLIIKRGDQNNPYFVSLRFLSSISNYQFS